MVESKFKKPFAALVFLGATMQPCVLAAKDLYVSTSGDDNVSYTENSINKPWKSIAKGVFSLKAGDTLYIRGGSYSLPAPLYVKSDYENKYRGGDTRFAMAAESGTSSSPVKIKSYPNETASIDLSSSGGLFISIDDKSYWEVSSLRFKGANSAIIIGNSAPTQHILIKDNLIESSGNGGDNAGRIKVDRPNAQYVNIEGNVIVGPGTGSGVHLNTSCIYLNETRYANVVNNECYNSPLGIYYKHANTGATESNTKLNISYNYIDGTTRAAMALNSNRAVISHNIVTKNNGEVYLSEANGKPGGDYNTISHNTFLSGLHLTHNTQSGDEIAGATNNVITNNILAYLYQDKYDRISQDMKNKASHNLFVEGGTILMLDGKSYTSIPSALTSTLGGSNYLIGVPSFVNSGLKKPSDYQLTSGSIGYKAASDGLDIGVDATKFGAAMVAANPPAAPVLSVQ